MLSVIKIEAHSKRTEPKYQGNAQTDFHTKAETIKESVKSVTHVDKAHSASAKI